MYIYIYSALIGTIKDSVSQNARCNSEKKHCSEFQVNKFLMAITYMCLVRPASQHIHLRWEKYYKYHKYYKYSCNVFIFPKLHAFCMLCCVWSELQDMFLKQRWWTREKPSIIDHSTYPVVISPKEHDWKLFQN